MDARDSVEEAIKILQQIHRSCDECPRGKANEVSVYR